MNYKKILITIAAILSLTMLVGCGKKIDVEITNVPLPDSIEESKENISDDNFSSNSVIKPMKQLEVSNEFKSTLEKLSSLGNKSYFYITSHEQHLWNNLDTLQTYEKGSQPILDNVLEVCTIDELNRFYDELKILTNATSNYIYDYRVDGDSYEQKNLYKASSTLEAKDYNYSVNNLESIDFTTAWVEGAEGHGIGEKITIRMQEYGWGDISDFGFKGSLEEGYRVMTEDEFNKSDSNEFYLKDEDRHLTYQEYLNNTKSLVRDNTANGYYNTLTGFYIVNGYAKNEEVFKANSRVKKLKLTLDGKEEYIIELEDTMNPQLIDIVYKQDPSFEVFNPIEATFEILEVYPGDKYEDTCITSLIGCVDTNMIMGG